MSFSLAEGKLNSTDLDAWKQSFSSFASALGIVL